MLKCNRLPSRVIAYVLESFAGKPHGHYMKRLPPLNIVVAGNKYDCFPSSAEDAVVIIVAYGDADRNLLQERQRNAREQFNKVFVNLAAKQKAHSQASQDAGRLVGPRKARAEGAAARFAEEITIAEREVERLKAIIEQVDKSLDNWETQESITVRYADVTSDLFTLTEDVLSLEPEESPLEAVKRRIREGDAYAIEEIRMLLPPEELSFEQIERLVLAHDKINRAPVSFMIQKIKEGRQNADQRGGVPELRGEGVVDRGPDDQREPDPEPVPAVQGSATKARKPDRVQPDKSKGPGRKR